MAWTLKLSETTEVRVADLPVQLLERVAADPGNAAPHWLALMEAPGLYPSAVPALIRAACSHEGLQPPDEVVGDLSELSGARALDLCDRYLRSVESDMPTGWADGVPPEGEPTTP